MKIKVCNYEGCSKVQLVKPATEEGAEDEVLNEVSVEDGQEVTLTVPNATDASAVEFGEVSDAEATA